jgi:hypothetical protein
LCSKRRFAVRESDVIDAFERVATRGPARDAESIFDAAQLHVGHRTPRASSGRGRLRVVAVAATCVFALSVVTVVVVARVDSDGAPSISTSGSCAFSAQPPDTTEHSELPPPPTSGRVAVVDRLGNTRGTIDLADLHPPGGQTVGTYDVPVADDNGRITGYVVPGYGAFVDRRSAEDPAILGALLADPNSVVDSNGNVITDDELQKRVRDGSACLR